MWEVDWIFEYSEMEQVMNQARRSLLRGTVSSAVLAVAVAAGLLRPGQARALEFMPTPATRNRLTEILSALRTSNPVATAAIQVKAPDIAEDGASVFINFFCALPQVDALFVFVDKNPQPLVASFWIAPEVVPALQMRIKIAQTANVWVVARSGGQFFKAAKAVKVTIGGCGAGVN